jgi:hypothetical protein
MWSSLFLCSEKERYQVYVESDSLLRYSRGLHMA